MWVKRPATTLCPREVSTSFWCKRPKRGSRWCASRAAIPFVFGRGGEEAEELAAAGIPFEIVPGVTSAVAVPAYAGIPVTHRRYTTLVTFITGHEDPTKDASTIPWPVLGHNPGTLVFLMGVKNLAENCRQLVQAGRAPETPAAVIEKGTTLAQRTVVGTLADIAARVREAEIKPPAVLVVGGVVDLAETLKWWENRPLWGKTAVVTRSRDQASRLVELLNNAGARCLEVPTIEIVPPANFSPLDAALQHLSRYDWVIFTSANGVSAFMDRLFHMGLDVRALGRAKIAVIGPATGDALKQYGLMADVVPKTFQAEGLLEVLTPRLLGGTRILLARAEQARDVLPEGLAQLGDGRGRGAGLPGGAPRRPFPMRPPGCLKRAGWISSPSPVPPRSTTSPGWWARTAFKAWPPTPPWPPSAPSPRPP